jgi:hypothetical protein
MRRIADRRFEMPNVPRFTLAVLLSLGLVTATPSPARAADVCIFLGGSPDWVLKGFSVPGKGKCKSVNGYNIGLGQPNTAVGNACTSTDGSHVTLQLTTAAAPPFAQGFLEVLKVPLPALTGGDFHESGLFPSAFNSPDQIGTVSLAKCGKPLPAAP